MSGAPPCVDGMRLEWPVAAPTCAAALALRGARKAEQASGAAPCALSRLSRRRPARRRSCCPGRGAVAVQHQSPRAESAAKRSGRAERNGAGERSEEWAVEESNLQPWD